MSLATVHSPRSTSVVDSEEGAREEALGVELAAAIIQSMSVFSRGGIDHAHSGRADTQPRNATRALKPSGLEGDRALMPERSPPPPRDGSVSGGLDAALRAYRDGHWDQHDNTDAMPRRFVSI